MSAYSYADTKAGAVQCLAENAVPELARAAEQAVQAGTHVWTPDPAVAGVWGLARVGSDALSPRADVVVYCTEGDFTASDEFAIGAMR